MGVFIGELKYVSDLVVFICEQIGDYFYFEVVVYLEMYFQVKSMNVDLDVFRVKVEVGVNSVIIQYFFNIDVYKFFVDSCEKRGLDILVVFGIMFIINYENLVWFF